MVHTHLSGQRFQQGFPTGTGKYVDPTIIESPIIDEVDPESLDEETREILYEADNARYQEAITNTKAIISLLCSDFSKSKENALEFALIKMWESEGIHEDDPSSWIKSRNGSCSLHNLYSLIKTISEDTGHPNYEGAKALHTELWSYFEVQKKICSAMQKLQTGLEIQSLQFFT